MLSMWLEVEKTNDTHYKNMNQTYRIIINYTVLYASNLHKIIAIEHMATIYTIYSVLRETNLAALIKCHNSNEFVLYHL